MMAMVLVAVGGYDLSAAADVVEEATLAAPLETAVLAAKPWLPADSGETDSIQLGTRHVRDSRGNGDNAGQSAALRRLDGAAAPRQDAAGIATADDNTFHLHKGPGLVRDVFRTRNMRALPGNWGIGHVRYPTAGSAYELRRSQPSTSIRPSASSSATTAT